MAADLRRELLEQIRFLHELGVESVAVPVASSVQVAPSAPAAITTEPVHVPGGDSDLASIRAAMGDCQRCGLAASRSQIVFGVGDPHADLMLVGEGPGEEEDRRGEPFVGKAGQLLDKMIAAIGLTREQVYIANIVKCRPPANRNPEAEEMAACGEFLAAQIAAVKPRALVALGKVAASALLQEDVLITRARGQLRSYGAIPLMPTFHPAYLLRKYTQENRRAVYDDLLAVKALVDKAGSR